MSASVDLDHVAVAVEHRRDAWPRYRRDLGGHWASSGESFGFALNQLAFDNRMRIEILRPHRVAENDFLRRFLDRNGPGPHHLTFKVDDIRDTIAVAEAAGYPAININLSQPQWMEAFLHPKTAHGVVVQLAESHDDDWVSPPPPAAFPAPAAGRPASLLRITHAVPSIDPAARLFGDVLRGTVIGEGHGTDSGRPAPEGTGRWMEFGWNGPGRIRLIEPSGPGSVADWIGSGTGRIHHLAFAVDDPAAVPDATDAANGTWVVTPEHNLGTRLVLEAR